MEAAKQTKVGICHFCDFDSAMLPISSTEFEAARRANDVLNIIVEVETEFLTVFVSYVELQRELLTAASRIAVFGPKLGPESELTAILVGAKLDFCLAIFRRYVDRLEGHVQKATENPTTSSAIKEVLNATHKESKEYRLLYNLRNYSMHRTTITETLSYNFQTDSFSNQKFLSLSANISQKTLLNWHFGSSNDSNRLSKFVLQDVNAMQPNEKISLSEYFRDLLPKLLKVHSKFRDLTRQREQDSIEKLDSITSFWVKNHPERKTESRQLEIRKIDCNSGQTEIELQLSEPYLQQLARVRSQTEMISPFGPTQVRI